MGCKIGCQQEIIFFYESSKVALTGGLMARSSTKMILSWCFLQVGDLLTGILEEDGFLQACSLKAVFTNLIVCFFTRISTATTFLEIFSLNRYFSSSGNWVSEFVTAWLLIALGILQTYVVLGN